MRKIIAILLCFLLSLPAFAQEQLLDREALLSALYEADIASLREALDLRLISSRELTEYYLERIETYNAEFNCFITLCDNALEEADKRDAAMADGTAEGILWGIPVVVKDNIAYEGYETTNGLWPEYRVSTENAAVVQALLDSGAVILGKTNMATEAQEARFTASDCIGETVNAYDPTLAAGGSSGGSAVATALNFAACGLGTDTNASLRYPAVLNGCVALRATKGLLDLQGCIVLNGSRDTPGAITRSVADQAIMLDVLTGGSYYENLDANALEGVRLGILTELTYPVTWSSERSEKAIDDEVTALFSAAVEALRDCGAEVIEVSLPNIFEYVERCEWDSASARAEFLAAYEALLTQNELDAVIFPTYLHTPQDSLATSGWEKIYRESFTSNCAKLSSPLGIPEIAVPIGTHSKGAGVGMEIAARANEEQLLLNLAYSYTEHCEQRVVPESAPNLYEGSLSMEEFLQAYKQSLVKKEREAEAVMKEGGMPASTQAPTQAPTTQMPATEPVREEATRAEVAFVWWLVLPGIVIAASLVCVVVYKKRKKHTSPLP